MAKVFYGAESTFGGAIDMSGGVAMSVGTRGGDYGKDANLAVQQVNIQAQRPLQQFYDLFSTNVYYVVGRVQCNTSMDRLLGPKGSMAALYQALSNPCLIGENVAVFKLAGKFCASGQEGGPQASTIDVLTGGSTVTLKNCASTSVSMALRSQDFVFMEQISFQATDMLTG